VVTKNTYELGKDIKGESENDVVLANMEVWEI
jgi:hypothetical protein